MKTKYVVSVDNIGNMEYTSKKLALECFDTYVTLSKNNETRAAGESVYLFINDELVKEYVGTIAQSENYYS
jgi:hypothetical protein